MKHRHNHRKKHPRIRRRSPPAAPPGTIAVDPSAPRPVIWVLAYGPDDFVERQAHDLQQIPALLGKHRVVWVHVQGLGDGEVILRLGELFGLHRLALEDVVNVHQRSKLEEYPDHLFLVTRGVQLDERFSSQQISLFLGANFLVSFEEFPSGQFEPVRQRLRTNAGRMRSEGPDFLLYCLVDAVIDSYFPVLERFADRLEQVENRLLDQPRPEVVLQLHDLRNQLLAMRRCAWPHRDSLATLTRDRLPLIGPQARVHLRDCYDHTAQVLDLLETYREIAADLRDFYMSSLSNRINETMRVLTVIATIFIPLTFLVGVWGMNFDPDSSPWNMPELRWYWGYPFSLALMAAIAAAMIAWFVRMGWMQLPWQRRPEDHP